MTEEFEQQVSAMLHSRVADLPASFEVDPTTLTRVRRRRATKLGALTTAIVLVAVGSVSGIARAMNDEPDRVAVSTQELRPVRTVLCSLRHEGGPRPYLQPPQPRVPAVGSSTDLSGLWSFAVDDDPRTVVLGPERWSCRTKLAPDGRSEVWLTDPQSPANGDPVVPSVEVQNNTLWRGPLASALACSVFDDDEVVAAATADGGGTSCPASDRTVTRIDANVATFVDASGARGGALLRLPRNSHRGLVGVLTCRPFGRLSVAQCDAIIADWIARARAVEPPTKPYVPPPGSVVAGAGCEGTATEAGGVSPRSVEAGHLSLAPTLEHYLADIDGSAFADVLGPRGWVCRMVRPEAGGPIVVFDPAAGSAPGGVAAPIVIESHLLWGDGNDAVTACEVFDDPALVAYVRRRFPVQCADKVGRAVTRVGSHAATYVVPDGTRGAGWYSLPSTDDADDGRLSLLTCRPTDGLSPEQCDTIVADYATRVDAWEPPR